MLLSTTKFNTSGAANMAASVSGLVPRRWQDLCNRVQWLTDVADLHLADILGRAAHTLPAEVAIVVGNLRTAGETENE